jgi:hypothetical protein
MLHNSLMFNISILMEKTCDNRRLVLSCYEGRSIGSLVIHIYHLSILYGLQS